MVVSFLKSHPILRTSGGLSSKHCPSQGRMDGPCSVSLEWWGRQRYTNQSGGVFYRQSERDERSATVVCLEHRDKMTCMLVDQNNGNILALDESVEG